jgi:pimeloyl-ACP methyl ester carboxylesterase
MPKIKLNNISMYYEIHGQGKESIVFISGLGADHLQWGPTLRQFSNQYQVVLLDNRGAGQTDAPPGPYAIEQMAQDVVLLCSHLGIQTAHFVGSSMGGYIVQMLAYRHASLVKSAVLSNTAMTSHSPYNVFSKALIELLKANAPLVTVIKASCAWLFSYQFLSQPGRIEELIELQLQNPFPMTLAGYEAQDAALNGFDSRSWVKEIKVPTLVMTADEDLVFNPRQVEALVQQIDGAQFYCFKTCGHLPHIECPEEFAKVVNKFLASS